jgi:hypothetical protein
MARFTAVGMLLGTLAFAGGCSKKVKLTFVNVTPEELTVSLSVDGGWKHTLGTVPPSGGKLWHRLKIKKDELPAQCQYRAGVHSGSFTVTEDTPDELWIDLRPGGRPRVRDKHTEVKETKTIEVERVPIHREEVIE